MLTENQQMVLDLIKQGPKKLIDLINITGKSSQYLLTLIRRIRNKGRNIITVGKAGTRGGEGWEYEYKDD